MERKTQDTFRRRSGAVEGGDNDMVVAVGGGGRLSGVSSKQTLEIH